MTLAAHRPAFAPWVSSALKAIGRKDQPMQATWEVSFLHVVPQVPQCVGQLCQSRSFFEFRRTIAAPSVSQVYRLLNSQVPIQYAEQGLGHIVDDRASARRADCHKRLAIF